MARFSALGVDFGVEQFLGPAFEMQRSIERIQDAIIPPSVRSMIEMQESLRALNPARMAGLHDFHALHETVAHDRLFASMRASEFMRGHEFMSSITVASAVTEQLLRGALGPQLACSAMPSIRLAESLNGLMPGALQLEWHEHLVKSIAPSFGLFATETPGRVGLLAFMPDPALGASLSWVSEATARPSVAALITEGARLPKITIDTVVLCVFCGDEIMQHDQTFRWKGNRIRVELTVLPICATCLKKAGDYAEYILDALSDLVHPPLKLVSKDGKSDGVPRGKGKLWLVTADEDREDDQALDGLEDSDEDDRE